MDTLQLSSLKPHVGDRVQVIAKVLNRSTQGLGGVKVRFYLGEDQVGKDQSIGIPAFSKEIVMTEFKPDREGRFLFTAVVDPDNAFAESDERNNQLAQAVVVWPLEQVKIGEDAPQPKGGEPKHPGPFEAKSPEVPPSQGKGQLFDTISPDLICEVETVNGVVTGSGASVEVKITNKGQAPSNHSFIVGFCLQTSAGASATLPTWSKTAAWMGKLSVTKYIDPGQSLYVYVPWQAAAPAGSPDYVAAVDLNDSVPGEASENNNISSPFKYFFVKIIPPEPLVGDEGPSIVVTDPKQYDVWPSISMDPNYKPSVKWKTKGAMDPNVKIILFRPGTEKDIENQSVIGNYWSIAYYWSCLTKQTENDGAYEHSGGYPTNQLGGPWRIRVKTLDGKVYGDSGEFWIGQASITVTSPANGAVWIPLQSYPINWLCKGGLPPWGEMLTHPGSQVDIALIPQAPGVTTSADSTNTIWIKKGVEFPGDTGSYGWDVPGYVKSGDYLVRVEASGIPHWGGSKAITVKSKLSSDVASLNPEEPELQLLDVFLDGGEVLSVKVRSMKSYDGPCTVKYRLAKFPKAPYAAWDYDDAYSKSSVVFQKGETKTFQILPLADYFLLNQDYTPKNPPLWAEIWIEPANLPGTPALTSTNSYSGLICKTKSPDICTIKRMELKVQSSEKWVNPWWSFYHETTATFSQYDLKWVSNDTFEITVRVPVRNWGGTDRWFDCYLYVDDLPGKPLGKFGLAPGGSQNVEQAVQIKGLTGVKRNDHQLVFIADQSEESNQGYPNSYMNNFVRIYLKIIPGGTITGKQ